MKNKNTATVLAFLTGVIGGQFFYLNKKGIGIICVLTCWTYIPAIAGIVHGVLLISMDKRTFDHKHNPEITRQLEAEAARKDFLLSKYGEEVGSELVARNIWQGMTKEMLIDCLGEPSKKKQDILKTKIKDKYSYGRYYTDRGTEKYRIEIRLENDEVVGWRDL
jgi:hypothetical protein